MESQKIPKPSEIWTANPRSQPIQPANCGIGVYAVVTIPGMDATQSGGVPEQGQWDNAAQSFRIPDELARLLDCFLKRGHPIISRDCPYVFSNKYGNGFTDAASLTYYWGKVSKRIGLPASIPPTRLRHIFVDERRSQNRVEGPVDADAAMVMGNSTQAWDRYYDLRFQQRNAAAAVTAMALWKANMLGQPAFIEPVLPTTRVELDVSELE